MEHLATIRAFKLHQTRQWMWIVAPSLQDAICILPLPFLPRLESRAGMWATYKCVQIKWVMQLHISHQMIPQSHCVFSKITKPERKAFWKQKVCRFFNKLFLNNVTSHCLHDNNNIIVTFFYESSYVFTLGGAWGSCNGSVYVMYVMDPTVTFTKSRQVIANTLN